MIRRLGVLAALLLVPLAAGLAQLRTIVSPFPNYPGDAEFKRMEVNEDLVFFDPRTSQVVIVLAPPSAKGKKDIEKIRIPIDFSLRSAARLSVDVSRLSPERWLYRYTVSNGVEAKGPIESWSLEIPQPRMPNPFNPQEIAFPVDRSRVWQFEHFSPRPGSWVVQWSRKRQPALAPGSSMSEFVMEADRRPGFLTAYFSSGREAPRIPERLSEKLKRQLLRFYENSNPGGSLLTLGPKFRPDQAPRAVAADFHVGISRLARHGQLEADSPFVLACLDYLQSLMDEPAWDTAGYAPDFRSNPQTPLEQSIYQIMRLALNLTE